ncbi:MAG: hypothetical protein OCC46_08030 [Pseudodesulfovibrio sp.]
MAENNGVWRWNVDPVWHHHSSMIQEVVLSMEATDDFTKYHHLRGCFYFGIGALEAFLNQQMRAKLTKDCFSEDEIFDILRWTNSFEKKCSWPSILCGKKTDIPQHHLEIIDNIRLLRDEVTHPKANDHWIYKSLDDVRPTKFVEAITSSIIYIYQELSTPFPYWLLGWNYVGMNGDIAYPSLSNNSMFTWSLANMKLGIPAGDERAQQWIQDYMTSIDGFNIIEEILDAYPDDMEPFRAIYRPTPRLTKRWWDRKYILERTPEKYRSMVKYI